MTYTFDVTLISDLHKDARGFRPRDYFWDMWDRADDDLKQSIWDNLCKELDSAIAEEKANQELSLAYFEEQVQNWITNFGAKDRETAVEWFIESLELDETDLRYGGSYICFELELPYSQAAEFDPICKKLLKKLEEAKSE